MRRWFLIPAVLAIFLVAGIIYFQAGRLEKAYNPDNLIRLHIIADSDAPAEQAVKRQVRDIIMDELAPELARVADAGEAHRLVVDKLPEMTALAQEQLATSGREYGVETQVGRFAFPTRSYGSFTLPAGEYEAVRLVLGEGRGENWWCVLFPPLCFVDISSSVADPAVPALAGPTEPESLELRLRLVDFLNASRSYLARIADRGA